MDNEVINRAASNAGVGNALLTTYGKLSYHAAKSAFFFGFLPIFLLSLSIWPYFATPQEFDIVKINLFQMVKDSNGFSKVRLRDANGDRKQLVVSTKYGDVEEFTPKQIGEVLDKLNPVMKSFYWFISSGFIAGLLGALLFNRLMSKYGERSQKHRRIRGSSDLVDAKTLSKLVKKEGASNYSFGNVALPDYAPMAGILAMGAQGSGKSIALKDLALQVFSKKRRTIIFDLKGDLYRAFFRPGKDYFFNPAFEGSVPWSIFNELKYSYDADTLAQAFLPPKGGVVAGAAGFFEDAARALFSVILLRLSQNGAVNTADIAKTFLEMPDKEMEHLIKNSIASSAIAGDSKGQKQGVISSIAIYLNGIKSINPGSWTIREFLEGDDDARFFIMGTEDTKAMFAPLYRLILTVAFQTIAAKQELTYEDKYWFILDEVMQLGDIKLDDYLATLRHYGVCIVCGIQAESQITVSISKDRAATVMNCFNTLLALRSNEASMMETVAKRLGKQEIKMVAQNQALAVTNFRDGAGLNTTEQEKWLVFPSEIGELSNCNGFIKIAGGFPVAEVDYSHWLPAKKSLLTSLFPSLRGKAYVDKFDPIQELPRRDPHFIVNKGQLEEGISAFDMNRTQMELEQEQAGSPKEGGKEMDRGEDISQYVKRF